MIYKKSIFQLKSKYVCEMMEGDLEIKDFEYDVGEVNLIHWENILKHHKDRKYRYIHVGSVKVQITLLQYYGKDIDLYALLCDIRHSINRSISLDRKVIGYKLGQLVSQYMKINYLKTLTMEICYEATNTNPNSIYIQQKYI